MTKGSGRAGGTRHDGFMRRLVVAFAFVCVVAACGGDDTSAPSTTSSSTTTTETTVPATTDAPTTTTASSSSTSTTSAAPSTTTALLPEPLEAWGRFDVDPAIFGKVTITDGAADTNRRFVLVGCAQFASGYPVWWSDGPAGWQRADGPGGVECLTQVEASPFGYFAAGRTQNPLHSADGINWEPLELADDFGFQEPGQLGVVLAIYVSPAGDRVTLLYSRAAQAESRIATLVTTTDGVTWELGPSDSAALFDSSDVSAVIDGGPGLIAVGASPGGEFVPTAAAFTSADGLNWKRTTPRSADFNDKTMTDVMAFGDTYVAVGGDFFSTGLMTAWTSPDGVEWTLSPHPPEETDPSVAHMTAEAVTVAGGRIWAAGRDFDARRGDNGLPAMWSSVDGVTWERDEFDDVRATVPFEVIDTPDLGIGVWPPPLSLSPDPVLVFGAD